MATHFFVSVVILAAIISDATVRSSLRTRDAAGLTRLRKCCSSTEVFDAKSMACVDESEAKIAARVTEGAEAEIPALLPDIMLSLGGGVASERKVSSVTELGDIFRGIVAQKSAVTFI